MAIKSKKPDNHRLLAIKHYMRQRLSYSDIGKLVGTSKQNVGKICRKNKIIYPQIKLYKSK
jgi:hypothetical protein